MSITPRSSQWIRWIRAISTRSSVWAVAVGRVCSNSVELINLGYSANPLLSNPAAARVIRDSRIKDICPRRWLLKTRKKIQFF